jgi:hypothetical protein
MDLEQFLILVTYLILGIFIKKKKKKKRAAWLIKRRKLLFVEQWFSNFLTCDTPKETRKFSRHPKYVQKFEMEAKIL